MKKRNIIMALFVSLILMMMMTACSNEANKINGENETNTNENGHGQENSDNAADNEEQTEEPTESYYDILSEQNEYEGTVFTVLDANWNIDRNQNIPVEEGLNGEVINDAMYMRDRFIEDTFGVTIDYIQIAGQNSNVGSQTLRKSVQAGESLYDLAIAPLLGGCLSTLATEDILYNLVDAPYLTLSSSWWSKLLYDNIKYQNKLYYTVGDITPTRAQAPGAIFVNRDLLRDYGIEDNLYQTVFDGKWTIDMLHSLSKDLYQDLNQDGKKKITEDFFGHVYENQTLSTNIFATGIGIKLSSSDASGNITVDLNSDMNLAKIDKLSAMLERVDNAAEIFNTFKNGRSLFLSHMLLSATLYLRDMEQDYGILPMPKWDEAQETYVSFANPWRSGFVAIPVTAEIEKAAFFTEVMGYASYEMVRPSIYDITIKTKAARDEESERIIDIILETSYLDLNGIYNFGGSTDVIMNAVFDSSPFVSAYEAKQSQIEKAISDFTAVMSK